ncbi:G-protein coupled receptor 3-like [Actinia tenebrosa]|uniref:G-protein coupled receptor 3-like n=1 Tax=Actinia tenebrosa TaxID=6105 RepID=A0A6P8HAA0_ACTTE|nr:G-protein coupled receptor 3-like [Actinia tenebrosa]
MYHLSLTIIATSSFLILTTITIDRFLALRLHLRYQEIATRRRCFITLFCIFVFSIAVGLCKELIEKKGTLIRVLTIISVFSFLSLLFLNAYLIFEISRVIRRHSVQIHSQQQSVKQSIDMPRYKKSVNTMYYVIGAFVLCYVPYAIVFAAITAINVSPTNAAYAMATVETLVMLNGVLNPIIYCWRIKELREKAMKMLH